MGIYNPEEISQTNSLTQNKRILETPVIRWEIVLPHIQIIIINMITINKAHIVIQHKYKITSRIHQLIIVESKTQR